MSGIIVAMGMGSTRVFGHSDYRKSHKTVLVEQAAAPTERAPSRSAR